MRRTRFPSAASAAARLIAVVGRHHPENGGGIVLGGEQGGGEDGGAAIPSHGLEHDARLFDPRLAQLFGGEETVLLITDDERRGEGGTGGAERGLLEEGAGGEERPVLFGIALAREGPEPGSRTAGEDHRVDPPADAREFLVQVESHGDVIGHRSIPLLIQPVAVQAVHHAAS